LAKCRMMPVTTGTVLISYRITMRYRKSKGLPVLAIGGSTLNLCPSGKGGVTRLTENCDRRHSKGRQPACTVTVVLIYPKRNAGKGRVE
jgi:hypothetical protein